MRGSLSGNNRWNNAKKRALARVQRDMRGVPGGWKRVFRVLRIDARRKGFTWPVLA